MKKIGLSFIALILVSVITTSAIVASPVEYVSSIFTKIGEWFSGSEDNEVVEAMLLFLESKAGNQFVFDLNVYLGKDYEDYDLNDFAVPLIFAGETEINPKSIDHLAKFYFIEKTRYEDEQEITYYERKKTSVFIDDLRQEDPYKTIFDELSTTTIVAYIDRMEDLENYTNMDHNFSGEWGYPFREVAFVTEEIGWYRPFGELRYHNGIDLAFAGDINTCGKPVYSITEGLVSDTDHGFLDEGRGYYIEVSYENWKVRYFHFQKPTPVKIGSVIEQGDFIGNVGTTGYSTACHLHLEIRDHNNQVFNPRSFIDFENPFKD